MRNILHRHNWLDISTFGSREQMFVCVQGNCPATMTKPWPHADTWEEQTLDMTTGRPEDYDHEAQIWAEMQGEKPNVTSLAELLAEDMLEEAEDAHTVDLADDDA